MIGDIMLLIPGLMSTNAIRDVLIGDTLSGIIRLIAALLLAAALALGFMSAIILLDVYKRQHEYRGRASVCYEAGTDHPGRIFRRGTWR